MAEKFDVLKMLQQSQDRHAAFDKWHESKGGCDSVIMGNINDAVHVLLAHVTDWIRTQRVDHEHEPSRLELAETGVEMLFGWTFPDRIKYSVTIDGYFDPAVTSNVIPGCSFGHCSSDWDDAVKSGVSNGLPDFLTHIPEHIAEGRILVHNHVKPQKTLGANGFRAWLDDYSSELYELCTCDWAGVNLKGRAHYRFRRPQDPRRK